MSDTVGEEVGEADGAMETVGETDGLLEGALDSVSASSVGGDEGCRLLGEGALETDGDKEGLTEGETDTVPRSVGEFEGLSDGGPVGDVLGL